MRLDPEASQSDSDSVALIGYVRQFLPMPLATNYVEGVRVCQHEPLRCTETSETGTWMLDGLEPEREILLTYEKDGYFTTYQALVTPRFSGVISRFLDLVPKTGDEAANGLGNISFTAFVVSDDLYLDNTIHVQLNPEPGVAPEYLLVPDYEGSLVIPEGRTAAFGIFRNLPIGEDYELEYTMDDGECTRVTGEWSGWPAKDERANVIRVPVGPDAFTYATMPACVRSHESAPKMQE